MNNTQKFILLSVVMFAFGYILMAWTVQYNQIKDEAYSQYEACVEREYNMLPSTYYASYGKAPECE